MRRRNGVRAGILGLVVAAATLAPGVAVAADITVTTTVDGDDKVCADHCTLREAVSAAGGSDRVILPGGTYRLTMGELFLTSDTIVGAGARTTAIDGGGTSRVLYVTEGTTQVSGVSIVRGTGQSERSPGLGGGIFVQSGTLQLTNSAVRGNTAEQGGGIATVGTALLIGTTVSGNAASFVRPTRGGGIWSSGALGMLNSTVSGNTATDLSGASLGGGVSSTGQLAITYTTIAGNTAAGGGFHVIQPQSGVLSILNSVLADAGDACSGAGIAALTASNNVVDDGSCQFKDPSNRQDVNPALGPLADNGGPTDTRALLPASAAISAAGTCTATDQRAVARPSPAGGTCDSGAYEYRAPTLKVVMAVVNDAGGTLTPSRFTVHVRTGGADVKGSPQAGDPEGATYVLDAGSTYAVAADAVAGYTFTASGDCTITLQEGDSRTCTITANDVAPTLRVITNVVNDDGGAAVAGDFSVHVRRDGAEVPGSPAPGLVGPTGRLYTLAADTYAVSADGVSGYSASLSGACAPAGSVTLALDQDAACTITLDDGASTLDVVMQVVNDDGGTAGPADFDVSVRDGEDHVPGSPQPGSGNGSVFSLGAGPYSVSTGAVPGYTTSVSGDCAADGSITLGLQESRTCTITANDVAPRLTVITRVINDHQGTTPPGGFSIHVRRGAADVAGSPQPGRPGGTTHTLEAETHVVSPDAVTGYGTTITGACAGDGSITLAVGDSRTCTITANDNAPAVRAQRQLPPPQPGKSVNALPTSGNVKVKLPGTSAFVALDEAEQLPVGTIVDARKGHVTLIAAADRSGGTATAEFWAGIFRLGQTNGAAPITTLTLLEKLSCPKSGKASAAAKRKKKRRLWGDGKGRFRTKGRYSSATVRGTRWLVEDRCTSTLTRVRKGRVAVRDFAKKKTVVVRAGKRYVAKRKRT